MCVETVFEMCVDKYAHLKNCRPTKFLTASKKKIQKHNSTPVGKYCWMDGTINDAAPTACADSVALSKGCLYYTPAGCTVGATGCTQDFCWMGSTFANGHCEFFLVI